MKENKISTIYVKLVDEVIDVWRPVKAQVLKPNIYLIVEQKVPEGEIWEFKPGSIVRIEEMGKSNGMSKIAVEIV